MSDSDKPDPDKPDNPTPTKRALKKRRAKKNKADRLMPERHRRFVLEYIVDFNGRAAAMRAGYAKGAATKRAMELLRRPAVQAMLRAELQEREDRTRITGDRVFREFGRIAFADPTRIASWGPNGVELVSSDQLSDDDKAAVKWVSTGGRKGQHAQRFEMHDKIDALSALAHMMGLLKHGRSGRVPASERQPAYADPEARAVEQAAARLKLAKLIDAKAQYLASEKFKALIEEQRAATDTTAPAEPAPEAESKSSESEDEKKPDSNDG